MSPYIRMVMLCGGLIAFLVTLFMVRRRELREKYATVWIGVAFGLLALGFMLDPIVYVAKRTFVMPTAIVLMGAIGVGYLFAFSVSVSLSRTYRRNMKLAQEVALLEERIRQLERKSETEPTPENE